MSAFDSLASDAARARADVAPAVARIEVSVGRRHGLACLAMGALALGGAMFATYRLGGEEARAEFAAFVQDERVKATEEKNRQAAAKVAIQAAADARTATAEARNLQGRIDAYVAELARRPVPDRCALTDADLRGLRGDAPTARARRRPARPAPSAE